MTEKITIAITIITGLALIAPLACGSEPSIRATQTEAGRASTLDLIARENARLTPYPTKTPGRKQVEEMREATAEAVHVKLTAEAEKCGGKDPRRYNCDAVALNTLTRKVKIQASYINGSLVDELNSLYNRRFERPRGAIVLKGAYVEGLDLDWSDPDKAFAKIEKHIGKQQAAEGRRVWSWIHEIVRACSRAEKEMKKTKDLQSELAGLWFPSKSYDWAKDTLGKAEAWLGATIRIECRHGSGLYALAEERADEHGIQNLPANWSR